MPVSVAKATSSGVYQPEALPASVARPLTSGVIPHEAPTTSSGYFKMWWTDPLGLTPTWAQANLTWNWERLLCVGYIAGSYGYGTDLGWSVNGSDPEGVVSGSCDMVGYTGGTFLSNSVFPPCTPLSPMYLKYDPVQVFGMSDGSLDGYGYTQATGPGLCYLLLTPHSAIYRTWN